WRILHPSAALSTVYFEDFLMQIFEYFQTVACLRDIAVSGLSLRSGAHSTDVRKTVNEVFELIYGDFGFHLPHRSGTDQTAQ
ncbi:hypothetical protein, partial [Marinobacter subterrani]|uniref:hypothetical protein n=1 Tax=Marinobacter subterrani TaxID=1658765 RepID=UPI00235223AC